MSSPVKAVAFVLARKDAQAANWYMRLAEAAPDISWADLERLRSFTPRRDVMSLSVELALA